VGYGRKCRILLMARSTGPILLTGGITFVNKWIGNNQGIDLKILLATGVAAGGLALIEQIPDFSTLAVGIAWIAFVTMMVAPLDGNSPIQNIEKITGT
jgi:hypothetical protein